MCAPLCFCIASSAITLKIVSNRLLFVFASRPRHSLNVCDFENSVYCTVSQEGNAIFVFYIVSFQYSKILKITVISDSGIDASMMRLKKHLQAKPYSRKIII